MIQDIQTDAQGSIIVESLNERLRYLEDIVYEQFYSLDDPSYEDELAELEEALDFVNANNISILYSQKAMQTAIQADMESRLTPDLIQELSEYIDWDRLTADKLSYYTSVDVNGESYYAYD